MRRQGFVGWRGRAVLVGGLAVVGFLFVCLFVCLFFVFFLMVQNSWHVGLRVCQLGQCQEVAVSPETGKLFTYKSSLLPPHCNPERNHICLQAEHQSPKLKKQQKNNVPPSKAEVFKFSALGWTAFPKAFLGTTLA